jgi:hypothetical protein
MPTSKAISKPPLNEVERVETVGKDHGRFEVRNHTVSQVVDWYVAQRSYPGAPRFPKLTTIAMVESRIERGDKIETERRSYISSRALSAAAFAAARGHWTIENKLHWADAASAPPGTLNTCWTFSGRYGVNLD